MPRAQDSYSKRAPAIAPGSEGPDNGAAAQQRIVHTPAGAPIVKPAGAVASIFDAAKPPPKPKREAPTPIDLAAVKVHTDRPLPPPVHGRAAAGATFAALYARMPVGGSVDLTKRQKIGFVSWSKRVQVPLETRQIGEDLYGVWRKSAAEPKPTAKQAKAP